VKILKGQTALLTGASRGLGLYMARALAHRGMNLVLAARSAEGLERVRKEIEAIGVRAIAVPTDVADRGALERLVEQATETFGAIDVLVNNAGIELPCAYEDLSLEEIERVIEVNLTGAMLLTRLVLPGMRERNRGHIVNISSLTGVLPVPFDAGYSTTKHGLVGFTRSLRLTAQCTGSAVSASVICPGYMDDAGMHEDNKRRYDVKAPRIAGSLAAERAGEAVIEAIERDLPDLMLAPGAPRLFIALAALAPRLFEWIAPRLGAFESETAIAERRAAERSESEGG
jgi:short-subunit dehydrogenase